MNAIADLLRGVLRFVVIAMLVVLGLVGVFVAWWLVIFAVLALSGYFALRRFFGAKPPVGAPPAAGPEGAVTIEGEYEVEREDGVRASGRIIEVLPTEPSNKDNNHRL